MASTTTIENILSETIEAARRRERSAFFPKYGNKWVLYGAGQLGRKVLKALRQHGIEPITFIDNDPELQGKQIDGLRVLSPVVGASNLGATATFIVTIFRGTGDDGMGARVQFLKTLGCEKVVTFLAVAWRFTSELLPHYGVDLPSTILSAKSDIAKTAAVWSDERSCEIFATQLLWRLQGDFSSVQPPSQDQYFPTDIFRRRADEAFVDCGAYDGDTLRILDSSFSRAWAIEPDHENANKLRRTVDPRVTVIECALGAVPSKGRFASGRGVASSLTDGNGIDVRIDTLDRLMEGQTPTFLKLDIEGAEQATLIGARELLLRTKPIVAVCIYHRPDDLWKIPLFLRTNLPTHHLFLRAHQYDGFELVAYAVPSDRLI